MRCQCIITTLDRIQLPKRFQKVAYGFIIVSAAGVVVLKICTRTAGDGEAAAAAATTSVVDTTTTDIAEKNDNPRRISKHVFLQQVKKRTDITLDDAKMYWDKLDPLEKGVLTLPELNIAARSLYYEFNRSQVDEIIGIARKVAQDAKTPSMLRLSYSPQETVGYFLRSTQQRVREFAEGTREEMQDVIHRAVRKCLTRALDIMGDQLKIVLKDPDMPLYLQVWDR